MRAIAPRWCSAAAAAPIRREIVAGAVTGVFVRLPFVLPRRRRRLLLLSAAAASPIMGSLNKREEGVAEEEKEKGKAPASEESQSQSPQKQLQAPEKPLPGDCCGSGCVRCVWDVYYEELDAYQKTLSSSAASNYATDN